MIFNLVHCPAPTEMEFKAALPQGSQSNYLGKLLKSELSVEAFWLRT